MKNASSAFLDAMRKFMRAIRVAISATVINPELLTSAERLQYDGYLRGEDSNSVIMTLAKDVVPIKRIIKRTGHSRNFVVRLSAHNGAELWRRLRAYGFRGEARVVSEWTTRRRRAETGNFNGCFRPGVPARLLITRSPVGMSDQPALGETPEYKTVINSSMRQSRPTLDFEAATTSP